MDEPFTLMFSRRYRNTDYPYAANIHATFRMEERQDRLTVLVEARSTWSLEDWADEWALESWQAEMVQRMIGRHLEKQRA